VLLPLIVVIGTAAIVAYLLIYKYKKFAKTAPVEKPPDENEQRPPSEDSIEADDSKKKYIQKVMDQVP